MEYNSQKDSLIMPEYGRNVQLLIQYAKHLEDPEHRQAFVEKIINLMHQMNPQNKNIDEYRLKLWRHLFHISNYEIEAETPDGRIPTLDEVIKKPDQVPYPRFQARLRHYGHNVQKLINKAMEMEKGPKRDAFVAVIASYMKLAYRTWNKENFVSDEFIKKDLETLSNGDVQLGDDVFLDNLSKPDTRRNFNHNNHNNNHHGRGNNRRNNSGGYQNNRGGNKYRNNNKKYRK